MDERQAAIQGLLNKAKENRGIETDEQKQRRLAVNYLAGKAQDTKPLRPGVSRLLGREGR